MPRYLITLTADEFVDASDFVHWLAHHELAEPGLHGRDIFYSKAQKPVKKGDIIIWLYKKPREKDVFLAGFAPVRSSVQGLFFRLPGPDGKSKHYHSVISIEPKGKVVKKVKMSQKQFDEVFKATCEAKAKKALTLEQLARSGTFVSEKEFRKLKGLLK